MPVPGNTWKNKTAPPCASLIQLQTEGGDQEEPGNYRVGDLSLTWCGVREASWKRWHPTCSLLWAGDGDQEEQRVLRRGEAWPNWYSRMIPHGCVLNRHMFTCKIQVDKAIHCRCIVCKSKRLVVALSPSVSGCINKLCHARCMETRQQEEPGNYRVGDLSLTWCGVREGFYNWKQKRKKKALYAKMWKDP